MQKFLYISLIWTIINTTIAFGDMSNPQEAIKRYDEIIKSEPSNAEAHFGKGIALHKIGKYREAIKYYDRAIKLKADDFKAYNNKGAAL